MIWFKFEKKIYNLDYCNCIIFDDINYDIILEYGKREVTLDISGITQEELESNYTRAKYLIERKLKSGTSGVAD